MLKKVSFFQGIGPNPLFAQEEQVDKCKNSTYFSKNSTYFSKNSTYM